MGCTFLERGPGDETQPDGDGLLWHRRHAHHGRRHRAEPRRATASCWPVAIAPFQVAILPLQMNVPEVVAAAEKLYAELSDAGFEVLLDDREERAGSKFKDADLIGIPFRLAIGARGLQEGIVELKHRRGGEVVKVAHDGVVAHLRGLVA
jgi:prolyl-tRNA synthetase